MKRQHSESEPSTSGVSQRKEHDGIMVSPYSGNKIMVNQNNTYTKCHVNYNLHLNEPLPSKDLNKLDGFPPRSNIFVGRSVEMQNILDMFDKNNKVIITGIAGIGKTRLAIQCATNWVETKLFFFAFFINAEMVKEATERIDSIKYQFSSQSVDKKGLIILDNVAQTSKLSLLLKMLEDANKNIKILATSQITEFKLQFQVFKLHSLEIKEGVTLVKRMVEDSRLALQKNNQKEAELLNLDEQDFESIERLVADLGCHALAIKHATSLILNDAIYSINKKPIVKCVDKYLKQLKEMLDKEYPVEETISDYTNKTYIAIKLNVEKATEESYVRDVLYCMAFMNPSFITLSCFEKYDCSKDNQIEEALKNLRKHSIIEIEETWKNIYWCGASMHRLICIVCSKLMKDSEKRNTEKRIVEINLQLYLKEWYSVDIIHAPYLLQHTSLNKEELAEIFLDVFKSSKRMEFLRKRIERIDLQMDDIQSWSVKHYCLFAGCDKLFDYFNDSIDSKSSDDWPYYFIKLLMVNPVSLLFSIFYPDRKYKKEMLIEKKVKGLTLLSFNSAFGLKLDEFIELLEDRIALSDIPFTDDDKNHLLNIAVRNKRYDFGYELIKRGANYHSIKCNGIDKALICAVASGDVALSHLLIKNGADVNFLDDEGCSAILYAIISLNFELIDWLVNNGACIKWTLQMERLRGKTYSDIYGYLLWGLYNYDDNILNYDTLKRVRSSREEKVGEHKEADIKKINKILANAD